MSCLPLNLSLKVGGPNLDHRQGPGKELDEGVKLGGDSVKWRIQVCLKGGAIPHSLSVLIEHLACAKHYSGRRDMAVNEPDKIACPLGPYILVDSHPIALSPWENMAHCCSTPNFWKGKPATWIFKNHKLSYCAYWQWFQCRGNPGARGPPVCSPWCETLLQWL